MSSADRSGDEEPKVGGTMPNSVSSTVYADPYTGLYHTDEEHAGPNPTAFTRSQAGVFGLDPCPTCYCSDDRDGGVVR